MEIKDEKKTALSFEPPEEVDELFRERERERNNEQFSRLQPRLFSWGIVISVFLIAAVYFLSDVSKVHAVSVTGNNYLDDRYIREIAGIDYQSRVFLVFPNRTAGKLKKNGMIENARINLLPENGVQIEVKERKPIGFRYEKDQATVLLSDGSETELTSKMLNIIGRVPYINGFYEEEQTRLLSKALSEISSEMIEEISEIDQYALDYDDEALMIRMRDGVVIFASYYSTGVLKNYHQIAGLHKNADNCVFAEQGMKYAYEKACPWNEIPQQYDYWKDADGNIIRNRWGDPAIKHFYRDSSGGYYLDASGNWIVIPIDAAGNDVYDPDFLAHYEAGYYAEGYLNIPEE